MLVEQRAFERHVASKRKRVMVMIEMAECTVAVAVGVHAVVKVHLSELAVMKMMHVVRGGERRRQHANAFTHSECRIDYVDLLRHRSCESVHCALVCYLLLQQASINRVSLNLNKCKYIIS